MILVVTGGRAFDDQEFANKMLDMFHKRHPIKALIHGAAKGADTCAGRWARSREIDDVPIPAWWAEYDKQAGPIRNSLLLKVAENYSIAIHGSPQHIACIAFPGGLGTWDMIQRCEGREIKVFKVEPPK